MGALCAASCGGTDAAFGAIRDRQSTADRILGDETIAELLGGSLADQSVVVEGTVVDAADGVGMTWTFAEDGAERRHILDFDDDEAWVRTVHLTLAIDQVIATGLRADVAEGDELRFGLVAGTEDEAAAIREGFDGESFVVFLDRTELWDYASGMCAVHLDGALLCRRGDSAALTCPGMPDDLAAVLKLDEVTEQMLEPQPT